MASVLVSAGEVEYVRRGFEAGVRGDGRGPLDFRQIEIETGVIGQATGSARVRLGTTDVLAEVGPPAEGAPNQGRISFATEFSPIASPSFQGRGGEELASDLTAMLQRTFFRSPVSGRAGLDLTTLSIVSGKSCWVVYVDVLVLAVGGAVVDTASIAVKAALTATLLPKIEMVAGEDPEDEPDYEIDDDPSVSVPLDTRYVPLTLTVSQVGVTPALDLDLLEEASAAAALSVGVDAEGRVDMLDIAEQRGIALHAAIDAHLTRQRANAWRALEAEEPEPLVYDEFAVALAGPSALASARACAQPFTGTAGPGKPHRARKLCLSNVTARVWWFDEQIRAALSSGTNAPRQVVVLGSGMDTRPWRCSDFPPGLLWFEVDLPAMVSAKGLALDALGAQKGTGPGEGARKHPLHVASWRALTADLSGPDWVQALAACGFDPGQPTLWIVEGLFMYLEPRDGTGLLHTMQGHSAPGSRLVTHNVTQELVDGVQDGSITEYPPYSQDLVRTWHYGFPAPLEPALAELGWRVTTKASRALIARSIFGAGSDEELEGCVEFDARLGCAMDRYSVFVAATVADVKPRT
ncbi:hypothetical protein APUTEX25_004028 [Auxenochlorella protothecoides]|uniref:Ribosomal RNA-processing protein 42 n=1 Tax=Auxenochlorella protothecoides TaxID=3075 RepID=A0A3M7L532_AUXPR|nr:hypothetical protein APUTEX25_004028 [Auxenochlorella protothecoides]|eukprot:RMZ57194.1 hypothetical protein APUTEX25_004028 [Auxenochlorella protothecoides]